MKTFKNGDYWVMSGQLAAMPNPIPAPNNSNCRNCGSSTYKVEITVNQTTTVCAHCGTRDITAAPGAMIDVSTHGRPGMALPDPSSFKTR